MSGTWAEYLDLTFEKVNGINTKKLMLLRTYALEVNVDEIEAMTPLNEHIYIASELQQLGIQVISLCTSLCGCVRDRCRLLAIWLHPSNLLPSIFEHRWIIAPLEGS